MDEQNQTNQTTEQGYISKKERRELRRQENQEMRNRDARNRTLKRILLWLGALAGIAVLVFAVMKLASKETAPGDTTPKILANAISESDWSRGNKDANVTLIEYGDFQCPACASYHPLVKQAFQEFGNDVHFAFRHFPLRTPHPNAQLAAQAAEAAGRQGKFWEMHDMLFEHQQEWSPKSRPNSLFTDYAGRIGIDQARFEKDLESDEVENEVDQDFRSGNSSGVDATPTFYLNGTKIKSPQSYDELKKLLTDAIAQTRN